MLYTVLRIGEKEYKLRFTINAVAGLERMHGCGIDGISKKGEITALRALLHCGLQAYNANVDVDKAGELIDDYLAAGNTLQDISEILKDALSNSGFLPKSPELPEATEATENQKA